MLTVFYGSDTLASRQKIAKAIDKEEGSLVRFDESTVSKEALLDTLGSVGLFGGRTMVVLDSVLEHEDARDFVLDIAENMTASSNVFYLLAGPLDVKTVRVLEKAGAILQKTDKAASKQREMPGSFALADAFARRDKKTAWVIFSKLQMDTVSPQEVCGTLAWQMRMVMLAHTTKTAQEAGVSDFPYKKAKACMKYFSQVDAEKTLQTLIGIYHFDPELNRGDTAGALERLILGL